MNDSFARGAESVLSDTQGHELAGRLAGDGGYATFDAGVVSIRRHDGKVVLEMTHETWNRLGRPCAKHAKDVT